MSLHPAIGVFDSGIGGLTVFQELRRQLPHENLIYLGDTARVPYGTKSKEAVTSYTKEAVSFLTKKGVKMVVIACNTASAFALPTLKKLVEIPLLGVIEPGVAAALKTTKSHKIGIIGTEGTIRSEAYPETVKKREPKTWILSQSCPLFVPFVEEGWFQHEATRLVAKSYLSLFHGKIDTLILGCTHYPVLKPILREVLPDVSLIDSAEETAQETKRLLESKNLLSPSSAKGEVQFFVTDSPERFRRVGEIFMKESLQGVQRVELT